LDLLWILALGSCLDVGWLLGLGCSWIWFTLCSFPGHGSQPHSRPVLTEDLWQILFTQAFLFATKYINRLRWRGPFGRVMPADDDAESIAAQAVPDFLLSHPACRIGPTPCGAPSLRIPHSPFHIQMSLPWVGHPSQHYFSAARLDNP